MDAIASWIDALSQAMMRCMSTYLVLGATGKTATRLIPHLTAAGHTVRAASRTPAGAAPGIEPVAFDWHDPATHDAALRGADGVYVVPPALRLDYGPDVEAFLARAEDAGVQRAVFLSARGAGGAMLEAEQALEASGLAWSVVRPTWFLQNFTEGAFTPAGGQVAAPGGGGAEPFIDVADIAEVVAALLTDPAHDGAVHELSGPRALTFAEVAAALGAEYADVDPAAWEQSLVGHGLPADYAALLGHLVGLIRTHQDAHLSQGVQQVLGREPTGLEAWAAREAGALAI